MTFMTSLWRYYDVMIDTENCYWLKDRLSDHDLLLLELLQL